MNDLFHNFHFLRPWLLVFLLLPLLLFFKKLKTGGNASSWADVCDKNLLNFLLVSNSGQRHFSVKKLIYTGLAVAAIAAAGPAWKKTEIPSLAVENPNMFVLSLAQDMQLTDITPSRLDRAKFMISDLAEHIPQGQFGLEVYSEEPYVITPIADDVKLLKNLLPQIRPDIVPDNGDRLLIWQLNDLKPQVMRRAALFYLLPTSGSGLTWHYNTSKKHLPLITKFTLLIHHFQETKSSKFWQIPETASI